MPDPKASNAVVHLVAFYSDREREYEAALASKDALIKATALQSAEAAESAAKLAAAVDRLRPLAASASRLLDEVGEGWNDRLARGEPMSARALDALREVLRLADGLRRG